MDLLKEQKKAKYSPLLDEESSSQSATEVDDVVYDGPTTCRRRTIVISLVAILMLAAYSAVILQVHSMWWDRERLHGANVIHSPIREYIHYEPKVFPQLENSAEYPFLGRPSDELDARWAKLMTYFFSEVPASHVEQLGHERAEMSIRLPNGNYLVNYAFIHQLHCIKRLHQAHWPDRYLPNMTEHEKEAQLEHSLHCLQMLLEAITCKLDEAPITLQWHPDKNKIRGNRTIEHECVNWGRLMEGLDKVRVDPFVPGLLVHPKYGPIAPDGRKSELKDRIGFNLVD